jgi:hypothetical protein
MVERRQERKEQVKNKTKRRSVISTDLMSHVTNKKRTHRQEVTTTNAMKPEHDGAASYLQDRISSYFVAGA